MPSLDEAFALSETKTRDREVETAKRFAAQESTPYGLVTWGGEYDANAQAFVGISDRGDRVLFQNNGWRAIGEPLAASRTLGTPFVTTYSGSPPA